VFVVSGVRFTVAVCFDIHFCVSDLPPADVLLFPSAWVDGPAEGGTSRTQGEQGRDSRLELVAETKLTVVNANWGVGEPRVTGQGGSMIVREGNVVARASSSGRIDYSWAIGEMSS
jgi:predicted amidohydrolase